MNGNINTAKAYRLQEAVWETNRRAHRAVSALCDCYPCLTMTKSIDEFNEYRRAMNERLFASDHLCDRHHL